MRRLRWSARSLAVIGSDQQRLLVLAGGIERAYPALADALAAQILNLGT